MQQLDASVLREFVEKIYISEVYTPDDIVGKIHELFSDRLTIG